MVAVVAGGGLDGVGETAVVLMVLMGLVRRRWC